MSKTQIFRDVTVDVLEYLKASDASGSDFVMELNSDGRTGTASGNTSVGHIVLSFDYDEAKAEMALAIVKKPMMVPAPLIWAEVSRTLRTAREALPAAGG